MLTEWPTRGRQIAADGSAVPELRSSSSATSSANQRAFNGTKWFGLIKRAPARRRTTGRGKGIAGRSDRKSARCRLKNMFSSGKEAAPRCDRSRGKSPRQRLLLPSRSSRPEFSAPFLVFHTHSSAKTRVKGNHSPLRSSLSS